MTILQKLTVRHLLHNRRRTLITLLGVALSVAMVTAVSGMVVSFQDLLYRDSVARSGLWHVRYADLGEEVMAQVAQEPVFSAWERISTEEGEVLSLQFARLHKGVFDESEAVCRRYGIGQEQVRYHNDLLVAKGILPGPYYRAVYSFAGILLALVGVGSVLVISNAFAISADQRSLQFGLLKSTGATARQIRGMVLFEGAALAAAGIPLGILGGLLAEWVALGIANQILEPMMVNLQVPFRLVVSPAALGVAVAAAAVTVYLSALLPARRAAKTAPVEAVRQTRSIRLNRRAVRVSPLTKRLFGFEGTLAAKTLARNRGKYRPTILALVVSIVLFIGVSSFGDILRKATGMIYADYGSNVIVSMMDGTVEQQNGLAAEMESWGLGSTHPSRKAAGEVLLPEGALTADYLRYFPGQAPPLRLYTVGDREFAQLCADLRIPLESLEAGGEPGGILLNTSGTYIRQGRRISFVPFRVAAGTRLPVTVGEWKGELAIWGSTDQIPTGVIPNFRTDAFGVIVPDRVCLELAGEEADFLWVSVLAPDSAAFVERAETLLEEALPFHTWSAVDYESIAQNNRNIGTLVMIFVYGFIGMLSLIGVTSVIATISTGIALRRREFAMLRSVGMTEAAIGKMLRYESLLYGLRALLIGMPLGLAACLLFHRAMTSVMDFPFIWPVNSALISIGAVLALTFSTMAFARRKQRQVNIVEALRDDII